MTVAGLRGSTAEPHGASSAFPKYHTWLKMKIRRARQLPGDGNAGPQ
jgi:hypothetical protein